MILSRSATIAEPLPVHKHHIVIGVGSIASLLCMVAILAVVGKSHRVSAAETNAVVIVIQSPKAIVWNPAATNDSTRTISDEPTLLSEVQITSHDGIPLKDDGAMFGLQKAGTVQMTKDLARFSQELSKYFETKRIQALITSAVRSSERQLEIIKERIDSHGMSDVFPELAGANVGDTAKWIKAWEWLKEQHVPVDPPTDFVKEDGNIAGASLHTKGLALDLAAADLDTLAEELSEYKLWSESHPTDGLKIAGLLRERDCVHLSLSD